MERGWFTDLAWRDGGVVVVHNTGARTPLDRVVVRAVGVARRATGRQRPAIWFSPEAPRLWYMIRSVAAFAGLRVVIDPADADVAFHFDDSTWSPAAAPFAGRTINYACRDISKSHVNRLFERVFGYPPGRGDPEAPDGG